MFRKFPSIEQSQFDSKILAKELAMIARNFYKNYH